MSRNRYIVECKVINVPIFILNPHVEIDTLWNVKVHIPIPFRIMLLVEIDTLWNVKEECLSEVQTVCGGRNRYIVECKGRMEIKLMLAAS